MARRKVKQTCSKCGDLLQKNRLGRYRYCKKCHAEHMRLTRPKYSQLTDEQRLKSNARGIVRYYVKRGVVEKKPCNRCGSFDSQPHHTDYSKPLDVVWLCRRHHLEEHGHNPQ